MDMKMTTSYLLLAMKMEDGQEPKNAGSLWKLEKIQENGFSFHLPKKEAEPCQHIDYSLVRPTLAF